MEQLASEVSNNGAADPMKGVEGAVRGLSSYTDELLMKRMMDGDKEAFEVLVARHLDMVTAHSSRLFADPAVGRSVAQDVFLDLWKSRHRFTNERSLRHHLLKLTLERCKMQKDRYHEGKSGGLCSPGMQGALERLELAEREILVMRFGMEMGYQEISHETGRPVDRLRAQIYTSLRKLRGFIEMEGAS